MSSEARAVPRVTALIAETVQDLRCAHIEALRRARTTRGEARSSFLRAATVIEAALYKAGAGAEPVGVSVEHLRA